MLDKGSIFLTEFPFTDLRRAKIRPVVLLHHDAGYDDVIVAAISSITSRSVSDSTILITAFDNGFGDTGLKKDSVILSHRIITINAKRLFYRLGRLPIHILEALDAKLLENFNIGMKAPLKQTGYYIPYSKQTIDERDIVSIVKTLRSDFLTQGPTVPAFEAAVAGYCEVQHAVAVSSGTAALHIACLALGVGQGDLVWTSPITFVASANCARYCGADVDFVDIDPRTWNMSPERLEKKLIAAKAAGRMPKVVIPVHFAGQSCDMTAIHALSKQYGFRIIEDACHALGGGYKEEPVGNCRYSDITVFSFHPVKSITTAEGGMAVTNDRFLANCMARLRTHGITRQPDEMTRTPDGPWYYQQIELGFNYRMSDVHAVLGVSQMKRLDEFIARRRDISARYDRTLADLPVSIPWRHPDTISGCHLYVIRLKLHRIQKTHKEIFNALRASGVGVNLHYIPVYRQPDFEKLGFEPGYCTEAERYYDEAISLPVFPDLTEEQQFLVVNSLKKALLS